MLQHKVRLLGALPKLPWASLGRTQQPAQVNSGVLEALAPQLAAGLQVFLAGCMCMMNDHSYTYNLQLILASKSEDNSG